MPIYEYQCQKCHHHLEALQKLSDKPLRECPECGKHTLLRLMSAPMFRLAGSGWYETDFKSDKENKRNLAGKDDAPPPAEKAAPAAASDKVDKKVETTPAPAAVKPAASASQSASKSAAKPAAKPAAKSKPATRKPAAKKTARKR
jgi:putative FmdB family regulatory protein